MSVQSARVQQGVKGDDINFRHQIMESVAFNAEESRQPVLLNTGDLVNFFYPMQDPTVTDLIGYSGSPVGAYPVSVFDVYIPSDIPATSLVPERGSKVLQSGPGLTVRAEVLRSILATTANSTDATNVLQNVGTLANVKLGMIVVGNGIPANSFVTAFDAIAQTITLNANVVGTQTGFNISIYSKETYYLIDEVDIYERGFPASLDDTSGGVNPPPGPLNLT